MIELDVIQWVVNLIKNEGSSISDNNLEYATALLMNLTLRISGKKKCEDLSEDLLKVLNENLEHENNQVRTYVNGTLYSVLESQKIRDEAKSLQMDQALTYLLNNSEQTFQTQIKYVLTRLNQSEEIDAKSQSSQADEEEDDWLEDDFDEDPFDDIEEQEMYQGLDVKGLPRGEEWLLSEFQADET